MGEEYDAYNLTDFEFDVLECYIKHGFGEMKVWQTTFFTCVNDEQIIMTLSQYYEKVLDYRNRRTENG